MHDVPDRLTEALQDGYTLQREPGRGGVATVRLATDHKHDRVVAERWFQRPPSPLAAAVQHAQRHRMR